jgi:glycosyltransferase involved in cell wall biosynthesis
MGITMQDKKKIMLLVPTLHQGGIERVCADTVRLLKDEFEIYLVLFYSGDKFYDIPGVQLIDLNLRALDGKIQKLVQVFRRAVKISQLQKKLKIDVCYSFGRTANLANVISNGKVKKIVSCHSFAEVQIANEMNLIIKRADKVICCAKAMKQEIEQHYSVNSDKIVSVWNPCDIKGIREKGQCEVPGEYQNFFNSNDKVITTMGREDDVKGYWHLLKAFKRVNEILPDTKLVIVGEGSFNEYKDMAGNMGINDRVLFTGVQKNPFPFLKASDVYVLSSLSEGLPNALVEALSLELPIVSVNCKSGPAEILTLDWEDIADEMDTVYSDYGVLTPPLIENKNTVCEMEDGKIKLEDSEEKLALALIEILENCQIYQKYKDSSLKRAIEFSSEKYKERMIDIIEGKI